MLKNGQALSRWIGLLLRVGLWCGVMVVVVVVLYTQVRVEGVQASVRRKGRLVACDNIQHP